MALSKYNQYYKSGELEETINFLIQNPDIDFKSHSIVNEHFSPVTEWLKECYTNSETELVSIIINDFMQKKKYEIMKWIMTYFRLIVTEQVISRTYYDGFFHKNLNIIRWLQDNFPKYYFINNIRWRFEESCLDGKLEIIQYWIGALPEIDFSIWLKDGIAKCCWRNRINVAKWLLKTLQTDNMERIIYYICEYGTLELMQYVMSENPIAVNGCDKLKMLVKSCLNFHNEVVFWIIQTFDITDINPDNFMNIIKKGNIEAFEWCLRYYPNILFDHRKLFVSCCYHGHIDMAKLLLDKYPFIDIHRRDNNNLSCEQEEYYIEKNNKACTHKYDYPDDPYASKLPTDVNKLFRECCQRGQLEIVKWLAKLMVIENKIYECAFVDSCKNGELDVAKWLLDVSENVDVQTHYHRAFITSSGNKYLDVVEWLVDITKYHETKYVYINDNWYIINPDTAIKKAFMTNVDGCQIWSDIDQTPDIELVLSYIKKIRRPKSA
jgi:hypothetical protein